MYLVLKHSNRCTLRPAFCLRKMNNRRQFANFPKGRRISRKRARKKNCKRVLTARAAGEAWQGLLWSCRDSVPLAHVHDSVLDIVKILVCTFRGMQQNRHPLLLHRFRRARLYTLHRPQRSQLPPAAPIRHSSASTIARHSVRSRSARTQPRPFVRNPCYDAARMVTAHRRKNLSLHAV